MTLFPIEDRRFPEIDLSNRRRRIGDEKAPGETNSHRGVITALYGRQFPFLLREVAVRVINVDLHCRIFS
jgi:hypothetical protein